MKDLIDSKLKQWLRSNGRAPDWNKHCEDYVTGEQLETMLTEAYEAGMTEERGKKK